MKNVLDDKYFCSGEEFGRGFKIGYCGETMRLIDFLMLCFLGDNEEHIRSNYKDCTVKYILEYVSQFAGKRLQKIKSR